jgi:hypothetical protein
MDTNSFEDRVLRLQWRQQVHDDRYHRDILLLAVGQRMKHFALHLAKYAGQLVDSIDEDDSSTQNRLMVDSFIITLAAANTLNINLAQSSRTPPVDNKYDLRSAGHFFAGELEYLADDKYWFVKQLIRSAGRMAKACESLDHTERFPSREALEAAVIDVYKLVLAYASMMRSDLEDDFLFRIKSVEAKHIFSQYHAEISERQP